MKYNFKFLVFVSLVSLSSFINANPLKWLYDAYDALHWNMSSSYQKKHAVQVLALIALQIKDRTTLYKLNSIQSLDLVLGTELAQPLNQMIAQFTNEPIEQPQKPIRPKEEILADMINNMKKYDILFPEDFANNHEEWKGERFDSYRMTIPTRKNQLQNAIKERETGNLCFDVTPFTKGLVPSEEFIEELTWHAKQTQLALNKKK